MSHSRLLMSGAVLLLLSATPAFTKSAMLSTESALHEGPGIEYAVIGMLPAGRFDLRQCVLNKKQENWCFADLIGKAGWIHVVLKAETRKGTPAAADSNAGSDGSTPSDKPGTPGGDPADGNEGISPIDGASLPGSSGGGTTKGDRLAAAQHPEKASGKY